MKKIVSFLLVLGLISSLLVFASNAESLKDYSKRVGTFEDEDLIRNGGYGDIQFEDGYMKIKPTENGTDGFVFFSFPESIAVSECACMVFKYKLTDGGKIVNDWIYPDVGPGLLQSGIASTTTFIGDGKWHLAILNMPSDFSNAGFAMPEDGTLKEIRVGVPNKISVEFDVAWFGTFSSVEDAEKYDALFCEKYSLKDDGGEQEPEVTAAPVEDVSKPGCLIEFNSDIYESLFYETQYISTPMYDDFDNCYVTDVPISEDPAVKLAITEFVEAGILPQIWCENYPVISIVVEADAEAGNKGNLYFTTANDKGFTEGKSAEFSYSSTEEWQVINIDFSKNEVYKGVLSDIRIDPFKEATNASQYKIMYIGFFTSVEAADNYYTEYTKEAEAPTETPEVEITETPVVTDCPQTEAPADSETNAPSDKEKKSGCGSIINGTICCALMFASLLIAKKKSSDI